MNEDEPKTPHPIKQKNSHALSIVLVILFIVCLIILLWVLMIAVRFLFGLAG